MPIAYLISQAFKPPNSWAMSNEIKMGYSMKFTQARHLKQVVDSFFGMESLASADLARLIMIYHIIKRSSMKFQ